MALIDLADDDDHADLIIGSSASYGADVVAPVLTTVLLGNGAGELREPMGPYEFGGVPLTLADFDGDGHTDFATPGRYIARDAMISEFSDIERPLVPSNAKHYWGDVTGDGRVDYVAVGATTIDVGPGNPDGTFDPLIRSNVAVPFLLEGILVDVNADHALDLVGIQVRPTDEVHTTSVLEVIRGNGDGHFVAERNEDFESAIDRLRFGDFNCDSWADLVLAFGDGRFEVRFGAPEGWKASGQVVALAEVPGDAIAIASDVAIGDVNADGAHDVVTVLRMQSNSTGDHDARLLVHVGDGRGGFSEPTLLLATENPIIPLLLAAGDLDMDRKDEIVAIDPETDQVVTLWDSE